MGVFRPDGRFLCGRGWGECSRQIAEPGPFHDLARAALDIDVAKVANTAQAGFNLFRQLEDGVCFTLSCVMSCIGWLALKTAAAPWVV